ncbi:MAG TPA: TerC family protein [Vicinamibacterales bacterium]|nr:TerC family protein [Vicinamibacterales bacterium]
MFEPAALAAFFQVVVIDLVLAGDNAVIIGMAAAGLPVRLRNRAILVGIIAATVLRIIFATVAMSLMAIGGLVLAGGLLLLWVCWKMWRELRTPRHDPRDVNDDGIPDTGPTKTFREAATQIVVADVSMSLDNVLAVAGAAREHPWVLVFGLVLSIGLMGLAASMVARLLHRWRWIGWIGLLLVLYIALRMIHHGWLEVRPMIGV